MARILVADDDYDLLDGVRITLEREGHQVACIAEPAGVLHEMAAFQPNLILLDIMMPGIDGWDVCRAVRQVSQVPIIFLTSLHGEQDVVDGLEMGGDDYITKPFARLELIARVGAVLRRVEIASHRAPQTSFCDGVLCIDLEEHTVFKRGSRVRLSRRLFDLLALLVRNAGKVMTKEQIMRAVWNRAHGPRTNEVAQYIRYLRVRIEDDPRSPVYILTRHGLGYSFQDEPEG